MTTSSNLPATTPQQATSPLNEVDEKSLEAIFSADPASLSDADVDRVVEYFDGKRQQFLSTPEGKGEKKGKKVAADDSLKLEDLGL